MNNLIGFEIPRETIKQILHGLDIKITHVTETSIGLEVPTYRSDVTRPADIVEEVLRVYGYNNIPSGTKLNSSIPDFNSQTANENYKRITQQFVAQGFYELYNNSLTTPKHGGLENEMVKILNPLSSELSVMRTNILYGMLETVAFNSNRQQQDLRFFEFGNTYHNSENGVIQEEILGVVVTGEQTSGHWRSNNQKADFFYLKGVIHALLSRFGVIAEEKPTNHPFFKEGIQLVHKNKTLGVLGVLATDKFQGIDIEQDVFGCTLSLKALTDGAKKRMQVASLSKFPTVQRDLALLVDQNVSFEALHEIALKTEKQLLKAVRLFDVFTGKGVPEGKKSYALSFTLSDNTKTLTDKQIDKVIQKIAHQYDKQLGATLR